VLSAELGQEVEPDCVSVYPGGHVFDPQSGAQPLLSGEMLAMRDRFKDSVCLRGTATIAIAFFVATILVWRVSAQTVTPVPPDRPFPDTPGLMAEISEDQKKIESLLSQYTFTDKITVYALDKSGNVRSQHTDTYYVTPTAYEFFTLHVSRDGKPVSQSNLEEQGKKIERRMRQDEHKTEKNEVIHPKDQLLFADIIARSNFIPFRWEKINGLQTIVYDFQPKSASRPAGSLTERIAGDLKGKMWISPEEKEVVRVEFASVSSLNLGMGLLGSVKGFQGFTEQQKFHGELWMPAREEYVAEGRELLKGFRIREVSEFSDYLKATTDVLQQIHSPSPSSAQSISQ
jgi:hypothetical protein